MPLTETQQVHSAHVYDVAPSRQCPQEARRSPSSHTHTPEYAAETQSGPAERTWWDFVKGTGTYVGQSNVGQPSGSDPPEALNLNSLEVHSSLNETLPFTHMTCVQHIVNAILAACQGHYEQYQRNSC
jgi:hypothetical protein